MFPSFSPQAKGSGFNSVGFQEVPFHVKEEAFRGRGLHNSAQKGYSTVGY